MKKMISLISASAMLLSFCACGAGEPEHPGPAAADVWDIAYYVDEFGQPTDEGYVYNTNYFVGRFSNSATTDSLLYVRVLFDKEDIAIFLYEYGKTLVKNAPLSSDDAYNITMRTADRTDLQLTGTLSSGGDRLWIDEDYESDVIEAFSQEGTVSFHIANADLPTTTYLFTAQASNFADKYQNLRGSRIIGSLLKLLDLIGLQALK